jgi:O-antigen ligase
MSYDWSFLVRPEFLKSHADRAKATFHNAIPFGATVTILLAVALVLYLHSARRFRLALMVFAVGALASIVGSKTRIVWVNALGVLALLAVRVPKLRAPAAALAALPIVGVLVLPLYHFDPLKVTRRLQDVESTYDRIAATDIAVLMIAERPLFGFGVGVNTFNHRKVDYYRSRDGAALPLDRLPFMPHNDLLNVAVLMGVVGLVVYVALFVAAWREIHIASTSSEPGSLAAGIALVAYAAFLVIVGTGLLNATMFMSYPQVLLFFLLGMTVSAPATLRGAP